MWEQINEVKLNENVSASAAILMKLQPIYFVSEKLPAVAAEKVVEKI
jgi:hypothetical protein